MSITYPDLEEKLMEWLREQKRSGDTVSCELFKTTALQLMEKFGGPLSENARTIWLSEFRERKNIEKEELLVYKIPQDILKEVEREQRQDQQHIVNIDNYGQLLDELQISKSIEMLKT